VTAKVLIEVTVKKGVIDPRWKAYAITSDLGSAVMSRIETTDGLRVPSPAQKVKFNS
jgi:hypothetical protein